mgnify:CR=1 FL=1
MAWTYDPTTSRGRVRLICTDTDSANQIFNDAEIDTFLVIEGDSLKKAAALALETIASQEALILKCVKTADVQTDGAKLAQTLLARAKSLRESADADDYTFDWAEQTLSDTNARDIVWNSALREG